MQNSEVVDISDTEFIKRDRGETKIINGKKPCCICKEWKPINNFCKNLYVKCGLNSSCRSCRRELAFGHDFKETRRVKLICMMGYGGKCSCCSISDISLLTIEHIRFRGFLLHYINTTRLMKELIKLNFPKGYTVLCYNCNLSSKHMPCIHSKEYEKIYNKRIKPYRYEKQKELDMLESKWRIMNGG